MFCLFFLVGLTGYLFSCDRGSSWVIVFFVVEVGLTEFLTFFCGGETLIAELELKFFLWRWD